MKIILNNVCKSYTDKQILNNISFTLESGKPTALLGRNGAGKTTLLRTIVGIIKSDTGTITVDGVPMDKSNISIGYLPEERGLYKQKKVYEQMMYFAKLKGMSTLSAKKNIDELLEKLEATEYKNMKLEKLSKGNQQKIQLAICVLNEPDLVIFDEPFSGLDPVNASLLKNLVEEMAQKNKIVIFSSHEMSYTESFCHNIVLINKGNIVLSGNLRDIKQSMSGDRIRLIFNNDKPQINKLIGLNEFSGLCNDYIVNSDQILIDKKDSTSILDIQRLLVYNDISPTTIEVAQPSLEDIFIQNVGDINE